MSRQGSAVPIGPAISAGYFVPMARSTRAIRHVHHRLHPWLPIRAFLLACGDGTSPKSGLVAVASS